jgi:DNA-binding MarR family transcriptional regulator
MCLQDDIERYLSKFGLSYGRFSILLSILGSDKKHLNGSEVAHLVGISKTTVSKMVKKLIEEGLIEIGKENKDSRENRYCLSKKCKKKLDKIIPGYLERMRIIGSNISIDEKKYLLKILNKVNFIGTKFKLSQFAERPISELSKEIAELCSTGSSESIDKVMEYLTNESDIPTTKVIDYYLGTVENIEGMKRIEHYLFNGTQIQRNYCTLFFVRINDWKLVDKAYKMGLIDYVQAYSK